MNPFAGPTGSLFVEQGLEEAFFNLIHVGLLANNAFILFQFFK